jgi:type VI secretion system secreted protein Hcp
VAFDAFLVIRSIPGNPPIGESPTTDSYFLKTFPNATVIPVIDFEFAVESPGAGVASSGAGAGKVTLDDLVIQKTIDKASPALFSACASGHAFAAVQLYLRKDGPGTGPGGTAAPFVGYEFQTAFITKIDWSGSDAEAEPTEQVTFAYGALAIAYKQVNPDGSTAGPPVTGSWNRVTSLPQVQDSIVLQ